MSKIDYLLYKKNISFFLNKPLKISAATNSLKIQRNQNSGRDNPYIWIDPSWEVFKNSYSLFSSFSYPNYMSPLYIQKHRQWCKTKRQIEGKMLLSVKLNKLNETVFQLSGGYQLRCYGYDLKLTDDDYDSWYATAS